MTLGAYARDVDTDSDGSVGCVTVTGKIMFGRISTFELDFIGHSMVNMGPNARNASYPSISFHFDQEIFSSVIISAKTTNQSVDVS